MEGWREDEEEGVSRPWMTVRKREDTETERRSTSSHYVEISLWKMLWTSL